MRKRLLVLVYCSGECFPPGSRFFKQTIERSSALLRQQTNRTTSDKCLDGGGDGDIAGVQANKDSKSYWGGGHCEKTVSNFKPNFQNMQTKFFTKCLIHTKNYAVVNNLQNIKESMKKCDRQNVKFYSDQWSKNYKCPQCFRQFILFFYLVELVIDNVNILN